MLGLLSILVASVLAAAGPDERIPVRVTVETVGAPAPEGIRVVARGGSGEEVAADLQGTDGASLPLLPGAPWRLRAEAQGFWGKEEVLVPRSGASLALHLWLASELRGTVAVDRGEPPPASLAVRFQAAGLEGTADCPIAENAFRCLLPAGRFDLRLRVKGFISQYRWNAEIRNKESIQLGTLALARGASVVGRVETATRAPLAGSCRVQLVPQGLPIDLESPRAARGKSLVLDAPVGERGFFHLDGVVPGSYTVIAHQPGFAPARQFPVTVYAGTELELLRPLVLAPPTSLQVILDPPRGPEDQPWRLLLSSLEPLSHRTSKIADAVSGDDGTWRHQDLAPGAYTLQVLDGTDGIFLSQDIEVEQEDTTLRLELPGLRLRGSVRLGDRPVAADLWFGGQHVVPRVHLHSDEDGAFAGVLPRDGRWNVEIRAPEANVHRKLSNLEVKKSPGAAEARLEIALPDTLLRGRVVRENGEGVERGIVFIAPLGSQELPMSEHTANDGTFQLHGLAPGLILLSAQATPADATEGSTPVTLTAGRKDPPIRLTVRPHIDLRGTVVSPAGGVPGAQVEVCPSQDPLGLFASETTDVEGRFSAHLPPGTREAWVVVSPPGFTLRALRTAVDKETPVTLPVDAPGGTLVLESSDPLFRNDIASAAATVLHGGAPLYYLSLRAWSAFNGQPQGDSRRLVVPHIEAGDYTVCRVFQDETLPFLSGGLPGDRCVSGRVPPLGELRLRVPHEPVRTAATPGGR